jgi:hypothetical protein
MDNGPLPAGSVSVAAEGLRDDVGMPDKRWDLFISHASEDKDSVARPLADLLRRGGARVWPDTHELTVGDSLIEKIDEGLSSSRFGAVVLSPAFFGKHWPRRELSGLRAREESDRKTILPIWHGLPSRAEATLTMSAAVDGTTVTSAP